MSTIQHRYHALDGLRGAAALLVVFYHTPWTTHFSDLRLVGNAYLAVDLFFIMSGFVIAANYAHKINDGPSCRAFLLTRFFRLYPLHLAVLLALLGLETVKLAMQGVVASDVPPFTGPNSIRLLVENLLMAQGWGLEDRLGWNPPSWSVSAECVSYAVFAALAVVGLLRRRGVILALAVLGFAAYMAIAATQETLDATYGFGLIRCLAGFFLGAGLQILAPRGDDRGRMARLTPIILMMIFAVLALAASTWTVAAIPLFVALIATLRFDRGAIAAALMTRSAQFLGRVSYSIYMIHMLAFQLTTMFAKRALQTSSHPGGHRQLLEFSSPWIGDLLFFAVLAIVLVLSQLAFMRIEEPGRRFGRRIVALLSKGDARLAPTELKTT